MAIGLRERERRTDTSQRCYYSLYQQKKKNHTRQHESFRLEGGCSDTEQETTKTNKMLNKMINLSDFGFFVLFQMLFFVVISSLFLVSLNHLLV